MTINVRAIGNVKNPLISFVLNGFAIKQLIKFNIKNNFYDAQ